MTRRLLIAGGAIAAGYLGLSYFVLSAALSAPGVQYDLTPADSGIPTEEVHFESDVDKIPLVG